MKHAIDNVIYRELRPDLDDITALYLPYNGLFEQMLPSEGYRYYGIADKEAYRWPCNNWPASLNFFSGVNYIPNRVDFDTIIINHRRLQSSIARQLSIAMHLPIILFDHDLPGASANEKVRKWVNSQMPDSTYVVGHPLVAEEWHIDDYIHLPYNFPVIEAGLKSTEVLVIGEYNRYDVQLVQAMKDSHKDVKTIGFSLGSPYKEYKELLEAILDARVVITASPDMAPPLMAMFAAACGCAVVTNHTRWTDRIFEHEKTALLFDGSNQIKKYVKALVEEQPLLNDISHGGQQLIREQYSPDKFLSAWSELLKEHSRKVYKL